MGLKTWVIKKGVFGGAVRLIARDFKGYRQAGMPRLTSYIAALLQRYQALPTEKNIFISVDVLRDMREWIGTTGDLSLRSVCYFVAKHEASVRGVEEDVLRAIGEILVELGLEEERGSIHSKAERYSTRDFDNAVKSLGHDPSLYIDPIAHGQEYADAIEEARTSARSEKAVFPEIDRRPDKQTSTGTWDHNSNTARTKETPTSARPQISKPKIDVRNEPTEPKQVLRTPFCGPVIIENPSPAIGGEKLNEWVGLTTSNGDFIAILDKFSWLPHSRTFRIPLATPITEPVTVTFVRKPRALRPACTKLGTFLLTGFSGDKAVPNALEIRVNAIDSGLTFEVRDAVGSRLAIKRQPENGSLG